ncbi:MAG: PKD domain-containing protein [Paludibacteraceae bacterium]|nr:PKD domain-containing protein [Paludibacteraceae bacterium]
MKKLIFGGLLAIVMLFAACENRSDVFKNNNTAPIILLADNEHMDLANDTFRLDMRYGEERILYYEYNDEYTVKDSLLFGIITHEGKQNALLARRIAHTNKIKIESLLPVTTLTDTITKATIQVGLEDYYQTQGSAWIKVSIHPNQPPTPSFIITQKEDREFRINAYNSTDPEKDAIVAYEFVIGSQDASELVFNQIGYETEDFNPYVPNANAGRAAKGGTYITATPIYSIYHIFQAPGTYSVSVRAKDALGLWSKWSTQQVEVE